MSCILPYRDTLQEKPILMLRNCSAKKKLNIFWNNKGCMILLYTLQQKYKLTTTTKYIKD